MVIKNMLTDKTILLDIQVEGCHYEMIKVLPGNFSMGGFGSFDSQVRKIAILHPFYIGRYPVTQQFWNKVTGEDSPSKYKGMHKPVDEIESSMIAKFLDAIKELTGFTFDIPTEEQWEFAAKGGIYSKGYKLAGSNEPSEIFGKNEIEDGYQSVTYDIGIFKPNELGIYDMNSNVAEWCHVNDPSEPLVLKGGVLGYEGGLLWEYCTVAERIGEGAECYTPNKGLRLVLNSF